DVADRVHALRGADVRARVPGRRHQARRGRHRAECAEAALHRVLELRARVPVRRADRARRPRADDEVRHVLRPHVDRTSADVRDRLSEPGAHVRPCRRHRAATRVCAGARLRVRSPARPHESLDDGAGRSARPHCRHRRLHVETVMSNDDQSRSRRREQAQRATHSNGPGPGAPASERVGESEGRSPSDKSVWREGFSIAPPEDAYVLRRQFTKFLVLTTAGMACGNGWIWLRSLGAAPRREYPERVIARASELTSGAVRTFSYPDPEDPCILFRRPDGSLAAFSQKCTHLSCAVYYAADHD